jgi:hypothetical protein
MHAVLQADTVINLLMKASEHMPHHLEPTSARRRHAHDVHTLLRVLCHKKDNSASTFLRIQYHLPRSSGETKLAMHYCCLSEKTKHMLVLIFVKNSPLFNPELLLRFTFQL